MNEDFYAVIKLISGEEIFSQVCSCEEKDKTILILDTPVVIETINIRQLGVNAVRVNPWLKYADDSILVTDSGMVKDFKLSHCENALPPISVSLELDSNVIDFNLLQLKND